jgi:hypothetical protein
VAAARQGVLRRHQHVILPPQRRRQVAHPWQLHAPRQPLFACMQGGLPGRARARHSAPSHHKLVVAAKAGQEVVQQPALLGAAALHQGEVVPQQQGPHRVVINGGALHAHSRRGAVRGGSRSRDVRELIAGTRLAVAAGADAAQ